MATDKTQEIELIPLDDNSFESISNIIFVKFAYSQDLCKIFHQPLFYLAENIKHRLLKLHAPDRVILDRIDEKLSFNLDSLQLNLLIMPVDLELLNDDEYTNSSNPSNPTNMSNKNHIHYIIDRFRKDDQFRFIYKNTEFLLKIAAINDNKPIAERKMGEYTLFSTYEIAFLRGNIDIFEDFIKTSTHYTDKFYQNVGKDDKKITMYLSSSEAGYFEFLGKRSKRTLESVYIPLKKKTAIIEDLEKFLKPDTKVRYNQLGINYKRTYLLEGLPGTGKSSLILALASHFNYNIAVVSFSPKITDIDLIRMLRSLEDRSDDETKKVFFIFEDIDCLFKERKSHDEQRNCITFSGLLNALDGIVTRENMISFITTNYKNNLDNALIRPGRVDFIMTFEAANKEQIIDMYKSFTLSTDSEQHKTFYRECQELNIPSITTSLLQQYLMKYIDEPAKAIENIDEIRKLYESCKVTNEAAETGLFS